MFGTDVVISTLMAASRSVYSWDIVVQRVQNKLFFDKRSKSELGKIDAASEMQFQPGCEAMPAKFVPFVIALFVSISSPKNRNR